MSACVGHFQKVKRSTGSTARAINVTFLGPFFVQNLSPPTVSTGKRRKRTEMFFVEIQRPSRSRNFEFLPSRSDIDLSRSNLENGLRQP